MKTIALLFRILFVLTCMISAGCVAQPDYSFKNPVLVSGTALQTGAVYRNAEVKPGLDAIMTIGFISPGVTVAELDGTSGYPEAIQPTLNLPSWTSGYLEMDLQFVQAGTETPEIQPQIAVTCIDVDGIADNDGLGHPVNEFDEINLGGGYADFSTVGGELSVAQSGNWFTGTNVAGVDYPGRDTAAKAVMFTIVNVNLSSAIIRVGVHNQTNNAASRLRSVYFKKFVYNNSILELNTPKAKVPRIKKVDGTTFKVYPSLIHTAAKMSVNTSKNGSAIVELIDYSGRRISQQHVVVDKGANDIPLFNLSSIGKGNYLAVLRMDGEVYNQKIVKL